MEKLVFAQKFPFSNTAREYLKKLGVESDLIPEAAIKRAALMVSKAYSKKNYSFGLSEASREYYENELIAFPVAKMFVSVLRAPNIMEKFSLMIQKNVFNELVESNDSKDLCLSLADDLKINYFIVDSKDFFVEVPLLSYLSIHFVDIESKLVNKSIVKGKILLSENDFARFLSEVAYIRVFASLPINKQQIPKNIQSLARSLDSQLVVLEKKNFDLQLTGRIDPNLFPPCMQVLYSDQLGGKKLSYWARLSLASFLYKVGMSKNELISLFSKSPDFDKKIVEYHINRIFDKDLSPPGCKKMREYALNVPECESACTYKHPVQYYLAQLRVMNRLKNKGSGLAGR